MSKVYRVQHRVTKVGPYHSGIRFDRNHNDEYRNPNPYHDQKLSENLSSFQWRGAGYLFGFASREQLTAWFDPEELEMLLNSEFEIAEIELSLIEHLVEGDKQIMFLLKSERQSRRETAISDSDQYWDMMGYASGMTISGGAQAQSISSDQIADTTVTSSKGVRVIVSMDSSGFLSTVVQELELPGPTSEPEKKEEKASPGKIRVNFTKNFRLNFQKIYIPAHSRGGPLGLQKPRKSMLTGGEGPGPPRRSPASPIRTPQPLLSYPSLLPTIGHIIRLQSCPVLGI